MTFFVFLHTWKEDTVKVFLMPLCGNNMWITFLLTSSTFYVLVEISTFIRL